MNARKSQQKFRKDIILGIVVNEYIKTISPVSSSLIANEYRMEFSSASIRNILAELESDGFLTHPHTSAGRVPTQDGYRYYVDHLMKEIQLLEEEKRRVQSAYQQDVNDLDDLLERTSEVISDLTNYTSIISFDDWAGRFIYRGAGYVVEYPDYQDVSKIKDILMELERKERLLKLINQKQEQNIRIFIGHEMACQNMDGCSLAVSRYRLNNGRTGRIAVLGPTRMDYQRVVSTLNYFSNLMEQLS